MEGKKELESQMTPRYSRIVPKEEKYDFNHPDSPRSELLSPTDNFVTLVLFVSSFNQLKLQS